MVFDIFYIFLTSVSILNAEKQIKDFGIYACINKVFVLYSIYNLKMRRSAMEFIKAYGGKYLLAETLIENDGHIGIPVHASLLFCNDRFTVKKNSGGTPIMIYVVGAQITRVGCGDDLEIINGMLDRGFAVVVLDYLGNEKAKRPALDWSVQKIRQKIISSELLLGSTAAFGEGKYPETLVIPSGYDVSYGNVFFELT